MEPTFQSPDFNSDNLPLPPPINSVIRALDPTNINVPGEIVISPQGQLLHKFLEFEGFVGDQLQAYNNWVVQRLPLQLATKSITFPDGKIAIFNRLHWEKPSTATGTEKPPPMFPREARDRGLTYAATLYVDAELYEGNNVVERASMIPLGRIPVPLGSVLCHTHRKSEYELLAMGECPKDPLGYFIINGSEKMIIIQEKLRMNRIFIFNKDAKGNPVCKMTSYTIRGSTVVFLSKSKHNGILLNLHFLGKDKTISVFQAFRLLGVTDHDQMMTTVVKFTKREWAKRIWYILQQSLLETMLVGNDIDDISEKRGSKSAPYEERRDEIINLLQEELFPQMAGEPVRNKLYLLAMMIARYAEFMAGLRKLDDRDHWGNKRLETAGRIMEQKFNGLLNAVVKQVTDAINKQANLPASLELIRKSITQATITDGFRNAFVLNNWGLTGKKGPYTKETIADYLKRGEAILSVFSQLTRINTPTSRQAKQPHIRMVQMSQLGYIDPIETPEGTACLETSTPVLMADGSEVPIGKLNNGDQVITINPVTLEQSITKISKYFIISTEEYGKPVVKIITFNGRNIVCTNDHPFLTQDGWVLARDLNPSVHLLAVYPGVKPLPHVVSTCVFMPIKSIEDHPPCLVADFTTESDNHSFIGNGYCVHNCGLIKHKAVGCFISIERDDTVIRQYIQPYIGDEWINALSVCILNGKFLGWCSGDEMKNYLIRLRRAALISKDAAIWLDSNNVLHVYTDGARPTRPLLIVDETGELVIRKKNLWGAKWDELVRQGAVEYIDASEQEYLDIAQSINDLDALKRELAEAVTRQKQEQERLARLEAQVIEGPITETQRQFILSVVPERVIQLLPEEAEVESERVVAPPQYIFRPPGAQKQEVLRVNEELVIVEQLTNEELVVLYQLAIETAKEAVSLARNTINDLTRQLKVTHCEVDPNAIIGIAASIIPLPDHNQAPRNTYQCSMGKQALGIYHSNHQLRFDTTVKMLAFPTRPIFETQMNQLLGLNILPAGQNVICAIMTYTGYNQEDSIIFNRASIDRGLFRMTIYRTYKSLQRHKGEIIETFIRPPPRKGDPSGKYDALDERGIAIIGSYVRTGDVVIGKMRTNRTTKQIESANTIIGLGEEGIVDRVLVSTNAEGSVIVKVKVRQVRAPIIGDKFASRFAQKSTIGLILDPEDMPFTSNGMMPDVIINPHCIPSRMTIAKLIEIVASKVGALQGERINATAFNNFDLDAFKRNLKQYGFNEYGNETMYSGFTGRMLQAQIFIGPCYYQALRHHVKDKIQMRSRGAIRAVTRQPVGGRARGGGLRLGFH